MRKEDEFVNVEKVKIQLKKLLDEKNNCEAKDEEKKAVGLLRL